MDENKFKKINIEPIRRTTLTVEEIAIYLGLSKDMIYKLVRGKRIPHVRVGSRILFKRESIDKWLFDIEEGGYE